MPRVSHAQGEIVYVDLVGPISPKVSLAKYLLTMMEGFSRFVMVAPLQKKSAKEVSSAILNTWVKGAGGIPKIFHTDNGKELTWRNSSTISWASILVLGGQGTTKVTPLKDFIEL